jgi:hypothetical protein
VEGGISLRFSPKYPKNIIQLSSPEQALKDTQKYYYALDMNPDNFKPSINDKINLIRLPIKDAEKDNSFRYGASTFDLNNQVIRDGLIYEGKRIITFSSILNHNSFPLADLITDLLEVSSHALNHPIEIEFAANLDTPEDEPKIFNYLQVRPIISQGKGIFNELPEIHEERIIVRSEKAMGNGIISNIHDLIYVKLDEYDPSNNPLIAQEIEAMNHAIKSENRSYILIGPGRWGSSDPWLGIPIKWQQISSVRLIVELGLENYKVDASQGTHFFHNLTSFGVGYFTVNTHLGDDLFNRHYLDLHKAQRETRFLRQVHFSKPLLVDIDGKNTRGIIFNP